MKISEKISLFWDDYFPILKFENELKRRGSQQTDEMKPYHEMRRSFRLVKKLYKEFITEKMRPIHMAIKAIDKIGMPTGCIIPYIICKHAPEHNKFIREKELAKWDMKMDVVYKSWIAQNPNTPAEIIAIKRNEFADARLKKIDELNQIDYTGILALDIIRSQIDQAFEEYYFKSEVGTLEEQNAKMKELNNLYNPLSPDAFANLIVKNVESIVPEDLIDKLWLHIKYANTYIVRTWRDSGAISESHSKDLIMNFKTYVPLHEWREKAYRPPVYLDGHPKKNYLKYYSEGRRTLAENPIIDMQNSAFIAIAEKVVNQAKDAMLKLVIKNLHVSKDLCSIGKAYYIHNDLKDEWTLSVDGEGNFVAPQKKMLKNGRAVGSISVHERLREPYFVNEHYVIVKKTTGDVIIAFTNRALDVAKAMNKNRMKKYIESLPEPL